MGPFARFENVSKMRGQGYDEAAAMSGKLNGAQAHILLFQTSLPALNLTVFEVRSFET